MLFYANVKSFLFISNHLSFSCLKPEGTSFITIFHFQFSSIFFLFRIFFFFQIISFRPFLFFYGKLFELFDLKSLKSSAFSFCKGKHNKINSNLASNSGVELHFCRPNETVKKNHGVVESFIKTTIYCLYENDSMNLF